MPANAPDRTLPGDECSSRTVTPKRPQSRDCQVRSEEHFDDGRPVKAVGALPGEINFSSKLVKVSKEDMIKKPKRTRNWKGRRAAERSRMKVLEGAPDQAKPSASLPVAEESFALDCLAHIEEYFRWPLPFSQKGCWDAGSAGGCTSQGIEVNSEDAGPCRHGGDRAVCRLWPFYFELFVEKVLESERLKREEDELVRKIERFLRRNGEEHKKRKDRENAEHGKRQEKEI